MKILLVQDTDWLARNIHQHHHLGERLRLRGHELTVIDHELLWRINGNRKRKLFSTRKVFRGVSKVLPGADVTVIRPRILKMPFLDYLSMLFTYDREISACVKESRPDVIIGMYLLSNLLALRVAKRHDIPFVFHVLEPYCEMIPSKALRPIGRLIAKRIFEQADSVVVINEGLREYAISMGARPETVSVNRAGIDHERFGPHVDGRTIRRRYGIADDETVLFFMGWLYRFSGLKEVLSELAKGDHDGLGVKLLIVGDGDAYEELQQMRTDLKLEHCVTLAGKQPYDKIPEFIAASDICLLPAHNNKIMRDIVPIKMYEYMAMGKPVIASRLPGVMKEFGTDNGVLYVERPEDALSKAMELIDADAIKNHGEKAREFVRHNNWSAIVDEFEAMLRAVVACSNVRGDIVRPSKTRTVGD
jgi:glycosyltransferase involved in cell wall biosynthesis